jgi:CheY-like chemotaxis protein
MKKLVSEENVEVAAVGTGAEAIDLLQSTTFDCLILDLSLPDMSGYELLERMNGADSLSHPPVIVYTGRELSREEEEKLQQYSSSIILKGAKSPERLLSEVGLFLHQVESKMAPERRKALQDMRDREKDLEGKKILLVDDDVRNIFALKNALEQRGAGIEIARNGKEAVHKVQTMPEVDLVLMDIMMPEMNGYEAMRAIRSDTKFKSLPIIAVTAKAMADDQEKCLEAGANDYLAKPIDLTKLLSLIRVWLHPARMS